jgi:diguanylate cyclase (GGDEF)-like protein/PAS domain S-box-containing protein
MSKKAEHQVSRAPVVAFDPGEGVQDQASSRFETSVTRPRSHPRGTNGLAKTERSADLDEELASVKSVLGVTLDNVDQGIMMIDAEHYVRLYNKRFVDLLSLPRSILTDPLHFRQIIEYQWSIKEFGGASEDIVNWIKAGGIFKSPAVYERRRPNGTMLEIRTTLLPDGGAVRTFSDITDRKLKEEALQRAEREYRGLFENAVVGVYRSTPDGQMLRANPALVRLNGYMDESEMLSAVNDAAGEWYVDPNRRAEFLREMRSHGRATDFISEVFRHKTRQKIWVSETAWAVRGEDGQVAYFEGTVIDASMRMQSEAKIAYMAHHDALTGLPNRAFLSERITKALREEASGSGGPFAIHYLDLDRFKEVNDTLGHAAGDTLLRLAGRRLQRCARASDVVARLGGDEFAVIQFDIRGERAVGELAARIVQSLSAPYKVGVHHANVGVSVGIALAPQDGEDVQELIKNADIALYQAKAGGRNIHRRFDQSIEARLQERRMNEIALRGALAKGQFVIEFQPIVAIGNGNVNGYEALLRWDHPQRGRIEPSVFIPIAEEIGIIEPIGEWVLREACAQIGRLPGTPYVSVNLSPFQFRSRGIVKTITNILTVTGLAPGRLVLEITETVLLRDDRTTKEALAQLRQLGVKIALDDFGAGHSSLHYLQKFQFDKIKIDRSFIATFDKDKINGAVVRAVVNLGHDLGISVIAEGVETDAQFDALAALDCQCAQGFLLGEPRPIEAWLDEPRGIAGGAASTIVKLALQAISSETAPGGEHSQRGRSAIESTSPSMKRSQRAS